MGLAKDILRKSAIDLLDNHMMALAAGLSYYFVMSLFPLLILLAAIVSFLPIPDLFGRVIDALSTFVPPDSMGLVRDIIQDVISPRRGQFLTIGLMVTLWTASSGFAALIEALNVAYEVPETRPIWKTRLVALGLVFVVGALLVSAVAVMFVGPQFGTWLEGKLGLEGTFAHTWPMIRWIIAVVFTVLAVELMLYWAPNVQQRHFWATLPGAIMGVGFWLAASYALGLYFQNFANFNKTYGTLAGAVALMIWLYWSWFVILVGAEINAEILKFTRGEKLPVKEVHEDGRQLSLLPPAWTEKEEAA